VAIQIKKPKTKRKEEDYHADCRIELFGASEYGKVNEPPPRRGRRDM
jgi:hypothetical protein